MNFYYEVHPIFKEHHNIPSVIAQYDVPDMMRFNFKGMQISDRVWVEDDEGVKFAKHRYRIDRELNDHDVKEFTFIKLKSVNIDECDFKNKVW